MPRQEAEGIACLIDAIESDDFPARLIEHIAKLARFDAATIFVHRSRSTPIHVFDNFEGSRAKNGIKEYIQSTYILNPFFQAAQQGIPTGVYRIRDLAPDTFHSSEYYRNFEIRITDREEIGYVTKDWPEGLSEIDVAARLSYDETAEIALYKTLRTGQFSEQDVTLLSMRCPILASCFKRFWSRRRDFYGRSGEQGGTALPRLDDFGGEKVTPRERQVLELVLRGHSSDSIATALGITLATVKSHRKNGYEKLGISTQAELLALFLAHLATSSAFARR